MTQLTFDLPRRIGLSRTDFLISDSNAAAIGWIDRWPDWPSRALALHGPAGCGKTQARGIAGLQLRLPVPGIAQGFGLEAAFGLVDRRQEIRWRARPLRHTTQRELIGFNSRALGLLPALNQ